MIQTDIIIIESYNHCLEMVKIAKNIGFEYTGNKFIFKRLSGRFLFETGKIDVAVGYLTGILNERAGIA